MFKIGDIVTCVDDAYLEDSLDIGCDYTVDIVFDEDHISVKGFFGMFHADRFMKKGEINV